MIFLIKTHHWIANSKYTFYSMKVDQQNRPYFWHRWMASNLRINCVSFGVRLDQSSWPLWTTPLYRRPLWASALVANKARIEMMLEKFILFWEDNRLKNPDTTRINFGFFISVLNVKLIMRRCSVTALGFLPSDRYRLNLML